MVLHPHCSRLGLCGRSIGIFLLFCSLFWQSSLAFASEQLYNEVQSIYIHYSNAKRDNCQLRADIINSMQAYSNRHEPVPERYQYSVAFLGEVPNPTIADLVRERIARTKAYFSGCHDGSANTSNRSAGAGSPKVVSRYEFNGQNGNFNTGAFDSVDADPYTTSSRLRPSTGITGGGANTFVMSNRLFDSSESAAPGLNAAGANQSTPRRFIEFDVVPGDYEVIYDSLSFYADTFYGGGAFVQVHLLDSSGTEQILSDPIQVPGRNAPVQLRVVDFGDIASRDVTTWRLYFWGTGASNQGVRFDDITLYAR